MHSLLPVGAAHLLVFMAGMILGSSVQVMCLDVINYFEWRVRNCYYNSAPGPDRT